jgi:hypothetical protein
MRFKDYKNEQVASALVEVFDRIYTYPLLRWKAFGLLLIFTTVPLFALGIVAARVLTPLTWIVGKRSGS